MNFLVRSIGFVAAAAGVSACASLPSDDGRPSSDATSPDIAMRDSGAVICELAGRDAIVRVLACESGTRYTLCDEHGGVIASNLDGAGLAAMRPDLDPRMLQADVGFEVMRFDPAE